MDVAEYRKAVKGKRGNPERDNQRTFTDLLEVYEAQGKLTWAPVPNGSHLQGTPIERARRISAWKGNGLLRIGVSDLIGCLAPRGRMWAIEMKGNEKLKASDDQDAWGMLVVKMGGLFAVAGSSTQAKFIIDGWIRSEQGS